ncbi:GH36 C-terminal domain-containing protein [Streptomyces sp. NPDC060022]|uniref:GH36 C-terminal domain-containing protein n=1 Tax=Streptomyces sp. NPDC060022 TaxID=3347039 RepID=UPI00367935B6
MGEETITVLRADSAAWSLPVAEDHRLSRVTGQWSAENRLHRDRPPLRPAGLDPTARYRDLRTGTVHSATVLGEYGLLPDLPPGDRASTAVHLVRTPRQASRQETALTDRSASATPRRRPASATLRVRR